MLLAADLPAGPRLGWSLTRGPALELLQRLTALVEETTQMGGRTEINLPVYVTAMHALVLDLVELTGAPTNGRRHPAHAEFLNRLDPGRGTGGAR